MDRQPDWWTYFLQCVRSARRNSRMDGKLSIRTPRCHRTGVSVPTNHPPTSNLRTLSPTAYSASVHANQAQWHLSGANISTTLSDAFGTCLPTIAPVYSSNVKVTVARYAPHTSAINCFPHTDAHLIRYVPVADGSIRYFNIFSGRAGNAFRSPHPVLFVLHRRHQHRQRLLYLRNQHRHRTHFWIWRKYFFCNSSVQVLRLVCLAVRARAD